MLPQWRKVIHRYDRPVGFKEEAKRRGLKTAYTIARAVSAGMNRTFAKSGYTFAGTLVNNTHISGHIQSMNIWWKDLCSPSTSS